MKCQLSIQEKLKDLRIEKGLSLEELESETGLSKSALGSYEYNDHKDISHTAIIVLAKFYGVSTDYLLGLIESRNAIGAIPNEQSKLCLDTDIACEFASRARDALLARKNKLSLLSLAATRIVYQL